MNDQHIPDQSSEPGISITRVIAAPRERIWAEWTTPEAMADWFGGTEVEIPLDTVEMDVREGGSWKATMLVGPSRREINWIGEYVEVSEPERLVYTITDTPEHPERGLVTVTLTDLGGGRTEMLMEQRGDMPPEQFKAAEKGWGGFLDRMEGRLAEAQG
jgi:uncharacterized protein YndB with AHSA1/START domain